MGGPKRVKGIVSPKVRVPFKTALRKQIEKQLLEKIENQVERLVENQVEHHLGEPIWEQVIGL